MEFFEVLKARHSVRAYADTPVQDEKINQILEAVNLAPSAGNLQAFAIYVVTRAEQCKELAKAAQGQNFMAQAPLALVFCTHSNRSARKYGERGANLYCLQDTTIACTYAMLAATALDLSSVWVGAFNESEVSRIINAPQTHHPVAMLSIGYAAEKPRIRGRRSLSDLVNWT
jgi:nitroreductase